MQIKVSTLKNIGIVLAIFLIGILGFFVFTGNNGTATSDTVTIVDGKQIINLTAKGGYSPSLIEAQANQETILKVSTRGTFDCSTALTIPSLGIKKNLPPTGETEIEIAAQKPGSVINGTCSMGMYSFQIKFV